MKNKLLILLTALFVSHWASAQKDLYSFSKTTATYAQLTGATKINPNAYPDFVTKFEVTLPFNFTLYNKTATKLFLDDYGNIGFVTGVGKKIAAISTGLVAFGEFDNTTGVFAKTEGMTGNRIYKIEFRKMQIYWADTVDYTNFQVWLHEGSNKIDIHYGPRTDFDITAYEMEDPTVGVFEVDTATNAYSNSFFLQGNPSSPTLTVDTPDAGIPHNMDGHIPSNTLYTFTRKNGNVSVQENPAGLFGALSVYPNPSKGYDITVSVESNTLVTYTLTDLQGKTILTKQGTETTTLLPTGQLATGLYILTAQNANGIIARQKLVVE